MWAKIVVFGGVVLGISLVGSVIAFLGGQAVLGADGVTLGDGGAVRTVVDAAIYLAGIGLLGLATC